MIFCWKMLGNDKTLLKPVHTRRTIPVGFQQIENLWIEIDLYMHGKSKPHRILSKLQNSQDFISRKRGSDHFMHRCETFLQYVHNTVSHFHCTRIFYIYKQNVPINK